MGKNQSASNLPNIIQYNNGSINFVSGSTLLMQISSSGAITTTGVISGSNALTASNAQTASSADQFTIRQNTTIGSNTSSLVVVNSLIGSDVLPDGDAVYNLGNNSGKQWNEVFANKYFGSLVGNADSATNSDKLDNLDSTSFVFTSSYNSASSSMSTRVTRIEGNYATTGSNIFTGAQTVCANITSTGTIIAQTLNVQQVTSSVVYSSGSNVFGNQLTDVQQMTGSLRITGSFTVTGSNAIFSVCCVGINTSAPAHPLQVNGAIALGNLAEEFTSNLSYAYPIIYAGNKSGLGNGDLVIQPRTTATRGIYFATRTGGAVSATNPDIRMAITYDGLVGIGCTTPGASLDINSGAALSLNVNSSQNTYLRFQKSGTSFGDIGNAESLATGGNACDLAVHARSTGNIVFATNFTERARITNAGIACFSGRVCAPAISADGANIRYADFQNYTFQIGTDTFSGGWYVYQPAGYRFTIKDGGVAVFACQVCAPSISMTGCIINTTDGGIFLKHSVNDKNFWVWQEFSNGWGQFTANCNTELNALGGLFAGSGLATFFTNCGGGGGITLSSLTGAGNVCGVIGLNHSNGNAYFAGNIGMGANLSTNWATRSVLQLGTFGTSLSGYNGGGGATQLMHNIIANGFTYTYMNTGGATSQYMDGDSIVWANAASGTAGAALTLIERMRITSGGNVGIGTCAPEGRLHIQGCTSGYGANLVLLNFCNATGVSTGIDFGVDASSAGCGNGNAQIKVCNIGAGLGGNAADMTFHTWNGAAFGERFRISCNGNIFVAGGTLTNSANYKAHTFCLFDATSIPGKTFTVSGNTQGCFSVTDFTGIPTSARAVLVYGWYHINGDGLAGQADHAVSWFGVQNNTSLQTWSSPTQPWPGETTTFRCCNFGTFVMEHDGDASATGMSNGMNYYGSWHQGIIGVDSGGCIKYNLAHGYSSGTHYNGLYAAGYWL